jgi:hypothetical protein
MQAEGNTFITMEQLSDAELAEVALVCFNEERTLCRDCKIRRSAYMVMACEIDCRYELGLEIATRLKAACAREGTG